MPAETVLAGTGTWGDAALVAADPAVTALHTVLDPDRLLTVLGSPASAVDRVGTVPVAERVEVVYLRYKPGTALVAGLRVHTAEGTRVAVARAVSAAGSPKLPKVLASAGRRRDVDAWALVDPAAGLAVFDAAADRHLPGIARVLADPTSPPIEVLRHKPERRWAARLAGPDRLVKVQRPAAAARTARAHQQLDGVLPLAAVHRSRPDRGVLTTCWVPGSPMDAVATDLDALRAVGALLARLHRTAPASGTLRRDATRELLVAVNGIGAVHPTAGRRARQVATAVRRRLGAVPARAALLHGDFSADQVVVGPDGRLTVLDLDRLGVGDPLQDLASWAAVDLLASDRTPSGRAAAAGRSTALRQGYADAGGPAVTTADVRGAATAAALLHRAAEPFRRRDVDWARGVEDVVDLAASVLAEGHREAG